MKKMMLFVLMLTVMVSCHMDYMCSNSFNNHPEILIVNEIEIKRSTGFTNEDKHPEIIEISNHGLKINTNEIDKI